MTQKKSLGQVFLHDHNILRKISAQPNLEPGDTLVEIGCGNGCLSQYLADHNAPLHIIEIDQQWVTEVSQKLRDKSHVTLHHHDVLTFDFSQIPGPLQVVANIPYYISAKILKKLIELKPRLKSATLMVQKEFAQKCVAAPSSKSYTSLTCYINAFFTIKTAFNVSRNCFFPVPKVDSAVLTLLPKPEDPELTDDFFNLIRAGFWARRKPFSSCLVKNPIHPYPKSVQHCPFFIEHPGIRAEALSLDQFKEVYRQVSSI